MSNSIINFVILFNDLSMKTKIINDPVHGFIKINNPLILDLIDHPYFQRLKRIKQLGLSEFVYPGAHHTRFHHALGAYFLMTKALNNLRLKGFEISENELESAQIAILLHDIGHGPFSHVLEFSLLKDIHHEDISSILMERLNEFFNGKLSLAINMFKDEYPRRFFHQLISSQLDVDRLDYLSRDSFYTGVKEGFIGAERLLEMISLKNDELVLEIKGIYSIENFLMARRLMYWQVYLHKTSIASESMLIQLINRAKDLNKNGHHLEIVKPFEIFLTKEIGKNEFESNNEIIDFFTDLDDHSIWGSINNWKYSSDKILRNLSKQFLNRELPKCLLESQKLNENFIIEQKSLVQNKWGLTNEEVNYFINEGNNSNSAYVSTTESIKIINKKGEVIDLLEASDLPTIHALSQVVKKYYFCYPKDIYLQNKLT